MNVSKFRVIKLKQLPLNKYKEKKKRLKWKSLGRKFMCRISYKSREIGNKLGVIGTKNFRNILFNFILDKIIIWEVKLIRTNLKICIYLIFNL